MHASLFGRAAAGAENPGQGRYSDEIAVVTGASKGSIAASVVAQLLDGGATVIATTSRLDADRLAFYKALYRDSARFGATLWVVPANMASYSDIDALVAWVGTEQTKALGRSRFTSRTRRPRRCCSRSRHRGWRAICPTPGRAPRWR